MSCIVDRDRKDPRHRPSGLSGRRPRQARQPLACAKTRRASALGLGQTAGCLYPGCMKQPAYSYDELDEIFRGNGRSGNIGISAIDGMIAALVAGPASVHPDEWLPIIFAGRVPAVIEGTPEHLAVNTIFNRYNEVSITLADNPQAYRPMFMNHEGSVIVNDWAAGFMLAVGKSTDAWTKDPAHRHAKSTRAYLRVA